MPSVCLPLMLLSKKHKNAKVLKSRNDWWTAVYYVNTGLTFSLAEIAMHLQKSAQKAQDFLTIFSMPQILLQQLQLHRNAYRMLSSSQLLLLLSTFSIWHCKIRKSLSTNRLNFPSIRRCCCCWNFRWWQWLFQHLWMLTSWFYCFEL